MCIERQVKLKVESVNAFKVFAVTKTHIDDNCFRLRSWFGSNIKLKYYYALNKLIKNDNDDLINSISFCGFYAFRDEESANNVAFKDKLSDRRIPESIWRQAFPGDNSIVLPVTLSGKIYEGVLTNYYNINIAYHSYRASHITVHATEEIIKKYNLIED